MPRSGKIAKQLGPEPLIETARDPLKEERSSYDFFTEGITGSTPF